MPKILAEKMMSAVELGTVGRASIIFFGNRQQWR